MSEVGLVLRVPEETHRKLKSACARHDRSMQKVVLALIEGWVANGSPDPSSYGREVVSRIDHERGIDIKARHALQDLSQTMKSLTDRIDKYESALDKLSDEFNSLLISLIANPKAYSPKE